VVRFATVLDCTARPGARRYLPKRFHSQLKKLLMKSAYELAMERLEKESPITKLNEAQKADIAEIESTYKARVAEREVFLRDQIAKAHFSGKEEEVAALEQELARDIRRLNEECEAKKEKVRRRSSTR